MLVVVNPLANGGRAGRRWAMLRSEVEARIGPFDECVGSNAAGAGSRIVEALRRGETRFVAAGGDGTVNLVVDLLMQHATPAARSRISVGAIGLGSSNDFHKPYNPRSTVGGAPCRLDFAHALEHDVGITTWRDAAGRRHVRHWLINASVGTTALGNRLYNDAMGLVGVAKRVSATLGMAAAALRALASPPQRLTLRDDDGHAIDARVRNLGIVKNPHFTGCLRYDSPYEPGSGDFTVHLLADTSLARTVRALAGLARGRFAGAGTATWRARRLFVESPTPFAVEGDGEVDTTCRAEFTIQPRALGVCAS